MNESSFYYTLINCKLFVTKLANMDTKLNNLFDFKSSVLQNISAVLSHFVENVFLTCYILLYSTKENNGWNVTAMPTKR